MFAKTIIDSDAFLDMPLSTQALYFHLSMRADDDGFINNPKKIQRMIGCSDDDLKLLIAKNFIIPFESGIVVIKHWRIHNYIRADRKKDTAYPEEMKLLAVKENGAYTISEDIPLIEGSDTADTGETARQKAYRESPLPYSFDYKIRQAFHGKKCPVCGAAMRGTVDECGARSNIHKPSIQHNIPISKGGKHELGNISVICHKCNVTLRDTETGRLNADEVIEVWERLSSDGQVTVKCQSDDGIGKDRIGKDSIDNNISTNVDISHSELNDDEPKHVLIDIVEKWNELTAYGITQVRFISAESPRHKMIRSRLKQYGKDSFNEVVENIKNSDFLQGKSNSSRPFIADFDWVIKPTNYPKVLEGKYNNRGTTPVTKTQDDYDGWQT